MKISYKQFFFRPVFAPKKKKMYGRLTSRAPHNPLQYSQRYDYFSNITFTVHADADYEDRPNAKYREWKNWLVVNVPGNNIKKGKTLAEYVPPIPAKGTGKPKKKSRFRKDTVSIFQSTLIICL